MALALVDFEKLKGMLDMQKSSEESYPELSAIIPRVQSAIQEFLGRDLERKESVEEDMVVMFPTTMLKLPKIPIESISSITYQPMGWDSAETIDATEYMATSYGVLLSFPIPENSRVIITYTGGYKNSKVPQAIRDAAVTQVAYEYQNKDHIGAETVSGEGGSKTTPALRLLAEVKEMLSNHIHPMKRVV